MGVYSLPPATKTSQTLHLHKTESENTAKGRSDHAEKVEDRVSLSHVVADVPCREQVDAALKIDSANRSQNTPTPEFSLTGKNPASSNPKITRHAAIAAQFCVNPMPIITAPQAIHKPARKILGPILRVRTVAGGWKMMYVMKNTSVIMDCAANHVSAAITPSIDLPEGEISSRSYSHISSLSPTSTQHSCPQSQRSTSSCGPSARRST